MAFGNSLWGDNTNVLDAAGSKLASQNLTESSSTTFSSAFDPAGSKLVGLFANVATVAAGTLDISFQYSTDKGVTWADMPGAANSQTAASLTQITAAGIVYKWFEGVFPPNSRVRLKMVWGLNSDMTFGSEVKWVSTDRSV